VIIARLKVETDPDGQRHLMGRTTSSWPLAVGTMVVLRRRSDEYELLELGERKCQTPTDQTLASFLEEEK
jgi:hypothetical protein